MGFKQKAYQYTETRFGRGEKKRPTNYSFKMGIKDNAFFLEIEIPSIEDHIRSIDPPPIEDTSFLYFLQWERKRAMRGNQISREMAVARVRVCVRENLLREVLGGVLFQAKMAN